ncbi:DNA adenine methylase [Fluviispira sanaruensis]|uniref:Site-specific DNA-methyltransferase (adenine-specific) n=1 Tax=Fluviispira sanaruensis TaxID=2493639 RepID=A0A4P2VKH0_FLUSA|nr:Dam family site-specific DNA-(adenine-N6)-methyltransferase [Fluviispira sanaruensis]BBH51769.1 DNA adenine methylase [Fluviispira sanaruensis]
MKDSNFLFPLKEKSKPILKWAGGKTNLLPHLIKIFPKNFDRYIEPFIGGGAVFLSLKKGTSAIINDYNEEIFNLYIGVRENPAEIAKYLDKFSSLYSEEFYYKLRKEIPENRYEKMARTIFLNKTGFNGLYRQNSKGEFNVPFGKRTFCPSLYESDNLFKVSERLNYAQILNEDFEMIIEQSGRGDFVYCDPPYEPLSITSSFNSYNSIGFNRKQQIRLYEACVRAAKRGACVAISNSNSNFILNLYNDFLINKLFAKRAINSNGNKRGKIEEVLVLICEESVSSLYFNQEIRKTLDCSLA